ncbi:MAG: hypothetical protein GX781_02870 [Clostridiales bacterium]|nr:hypothetical protein [Clostridiales bacterium]
MIYYPVTIKQIIQMGQGIVSFYVSKPEGLDWEEATHIHVALPDFDADGTANKALVHHLSLISLPFEEDIIITTRLDSSDSLFKKRLASLQAGDGLILFKPGSYLRFERDGRPVVLITMGVAAAVARPLVKRYLQNSEGIPSLTCISLSSTRPAPFAGELDALGTPGLSLVRPRNRYELLDCLKNIQTDPDPRWLVLGSDEFLRDIILALRCRGIKDEDIVLDLKPQKRAALYERMGLDAAQATAPPNTSML